MTMVWYTPYGLTDQAQQYASAGASMISVLTEPKWFKGSLDDMQAAREVMEAQEHRPAILRKDFIIDEYQLLEARAYGADCVLLIVAILTPKELTQLIEVRCAQMQMPHSIAVADGRYGIPRSMIGDAQTRNGPSR
jgi:indole-3-glycerol phosphate synthase